MIKRFEELKQDDSNNNYIYWGKEESNNVAQHMEMQVLKYHYIFSRKTATVEMLKKMYEDAKKI